MRLHAIEYARSCLPENMVLAGGAENKRLEISFLLYVVETNTGKVLIDAGCDSLPGFEMRNFISPVKALSDYGIPAEEIMDVVITHAHHDHIDGLRHFPHARIHIQADEYRKGLTYIPENANLKIFEACSWVDDVLMIQRIGGHSVGSCIAKIKIGNEIFIFGGDECYLPICLEKNIPTGVSHNREASIHFVTEYSRPGYRVLLAHHTNIHTGIII